MNLTYAKWLKLPIKVLRHPCPLFNVDRLTNKQGDLKFYSNLKMRTSTIVKNMRFFLSNLGNHQVILGYLWFAACQPKIDWVKGWIDISQLPMVISTPDAPNMRLASCPSFAMKGRTQDNWEMGQKIYIARVSFPPNQIVEEDLKALQNIPLKYQHHTQVFSESAAQRFPGPRIWDHTIELKANAPATIPGKIYALTVAEQEELLKFIKEHVSKGYI